MPQILEHFSRLTKLANEATRQSHTVFSFIYLLSDFEEHVDLNFSFRIRDRINMEKVHIEIFNFFVFNQNIVNQLKKYSKKSLLMTSEELVTVLPSTIYFPQTFITATVRFTATIRNNSDKTLHYRWCKYATEEEDNEALNEIDVYDPSQRAKIEQLLEFNSPNFFADPPRGEVWPHRSQIVVFEFTPDVAKPYDILLM